MEITSMNNAELHMAGYQSMIDISIRKKEGISGMTDQSIIILYR
jgi:hypothetical protein